MIFGSKIETINDAYAHALNFMHNGEQQLIEALPNMAEASSDPQLKQGFTKHQQETQEHARRLEQVAQNCGIDLKNPTCPVMESMIKAGDKIVSSTEMGPVRDAMLIAAAQKVEHFEIASYGSLIAMARQCNAPQDCIQMLTQTMNEEKACDQQLTKVAESGPNMQATKRAA